jgi:hypothetical protein
LKQERTLKFSLFFLFFFLITKITMSPKRKNNPRINIIFIFNHSTEEMINGLPLIKFAKLRKKLLRKIIRRRVPKRIRKIKMINIPNMKAWTMLRSWFIRKSPSLRPFIVYKLAAISLRPGTTVHILLIIIILTVCISVSFV